MDDLTTTLLQRATPSTPEQSPMTMPSAPHHVAPAWQRYATAQKMMQNVRDHWNPSPILTRIMDK